MHTPTHTPTPQGPDRLRIYISGGISGRPAHEYARHFAAAAERLARAGYAVVNPLENGLPKEAGWHAHMRADIRRLTYCHEIYMLAGWERSTGASAEHALARALGMAVHYEKPPKHPEVKHAILTALGVTFRDICRKGRQRRVVYARFIYCHYAAEAGDTATTIAQELGHKHSNVSYYLRRYEPELNYNREFRNAAQAVADLLALTAYTSKAGESDSAPDGSDGHLSGHTPDTDNTQRPCTTPGQKPT